MIPSEFPEWIHLVESNYREILSAAQYPKPQLVTEPNFKRLYDARLASGVMGFYYYWANSCYSEPKNVNSAINYTKSIAGKAFDVVKKAMDCYGKYLDRAKENRTVSDVAAGASGEMSVHEACTVIRDWNNATHDIFYRVYKSNPSASEVAEGLPTELVTRSWDYQRLIDMRCITKIPLPVKALFNAAQGELGEKEEADLKEWAEIVQDKSATTEQITAIRLHNFVNAFLVEVVKIPLKSIAKEIQQIEEILTSETIGCKLLDQEDPKAVKKALSHRSGEIVALGGTKYTLGEQITSRPIIIFNVEKKPSVQVLFSGNAMLIRRRQKAIGMSKLIPASAMLFIDPTGTEAVIERTYNHEDVFKWGESLEENCKQAKHFIDLCKQLAELFGHELPFSLQDISFNLSGEPRLGFPTYKKGKVRLRFHELDQYIYLVSRKNRKLYLEITEITQMPKKTMAEIYEQIIKKALTYRYQTRDQLTDEISAETQKKEIESMLLGRGITDPTTVSFAKQLFDKTVEFYDDCNRKMTGKEGLNRLHHKDQEKLKEILIEGFKSVRFSPLIASTEGKPIRNFVSANVIHTLKVWAEEERLRARIAAARNSSLVSPMVSPVKVVVAPTSGVSGVAPKPPPAQAAVRGRLMIPKYRVNFPLRGGMRGGKR